MNKFLLLSTTAALSNVAFAQPTDVDLRTSTHTYHEFYNTSLVSPGSFSDVQSSYLNPGAGLTDVYNLGAKGFVWSMRPSMDGREYQLWDETAHTGGTGGTTATKSYRVHGVNTAEADVAHVDMSYSLTNATPTVPLLRVDFKVTNTTTRALEYDLYSLSYMSGKTSSTDSTNNGAYNNGVFSFSGSQGVPAYFWSSGLAPTSWEMSTLYTSGDTLQSLVDNKVTGNLSNSVIRNSGTLSGTFHWHISLKSNESVSGSIYKSVGAVPEPTSIAVLGLGALLTIRRRRSA